MLILLSMCIRIGPLSKWMVHGGSQVPHCWIGSLQISKIRRLE